MPKPRQLSFLPPLPKEHGGESSVGRRKTKRNFSPKLPVHLTLKASSARGDRSLLHPKNKGHIHFLLNETADKYRIRLYRFANVGNHLHLLIQARSHEDFKGFLREITGRIASFVTGAIKGRPEKFWDHLAHSRLVSWGRDFANAHAYIIKNFLEGIRAIDRYGMDRELKIIPVTAMGPPSG